MTIYTQADADAAKAKLALDTQALADDQQAALAARAGATSAAQAVTDAQAQADAAAAAVVAAQQNAAVAQAALSSANDAVTAVQADMVAQQAIIDAFAAQPPVVTPPPPPPTTNMPVMPDMPVGPFAKHSTIAVKSGAAINLNKVEFGGSYECISHTDKTIKLSALNLQDVTCDDQAGSLFYCASMCGGGDVSIGRVGCTKTRRGRPFLRFCGVWGKIEIESLTAIYDTTPNTMTGDIATGIQVGNKATGEAIESVIIHKAHVEGIHCNWPTSKYWNGDGLTTERTLKYFQVDNGYFKDITDGGIDSKARKNVFGTIYGENCRQTLKLWDDTHAGRVISVNPRLEGGIGGTSHFRLMGAGDGRVRVYEFPDVTAKGSAPLFHIENGPVKIVAAGTYDGSTLLVKVNGGSVTADSTWNGKPIK